MNFSMRIPPVFHGVWSRTVALLATGLLVGVTQQASGQTVRIEKTVYIGNAGVGGCVGASELARATNGTAITYCFEVTAVGASLTGKGAFDVDTMALMMSQGMSGAEGALDLSLTGANGLMDKLVAMGLVPQDQVMGVRMMMGMFAVPAGDDAFTSKIEVKKDGQILANGQRIK